MKQIPSTYVPDYFYRLIATYDATPICKKGPGAISRFPPLYPQDVTGMALASRYLTQTARKKFDSAICKNVHRLQ